MFSIIRGDVTEIIIDLNDLEISKLNDINSPNIIDLGKTIKFYKSRGEVVGRFTPLTKTI